MPNDNSSPSLPALGRGLRILDVLIREGGPVRFNELRAKLPGIQDSTLTRILKALEAYEYIHRDPDNGYCITKQVQDWGHFLNVSEPDLNTLAAQTVEQLVEQGRESAAIVIFKNQQLTTIASKTQPDGISILKLGHTLHFEPDHAGSIAILNSIPETLRQECIDGPISRFLPNTNFNQIVKDMETDKGVFKDRSTFRPGVCRIGQMFRNGEVLGAVFYCMTLEACKVKEMELSSLILAAATRLNKS